MAYAYAFPVTLLNPASTLTNFPYAIQTTDTRLKTVSNGGLVTSSSGYDIMVSLTAGGSPLAFDRESWDGTTGDLVIWVLIPSYTASMTLYVCVGDSSVTTEQATPATVWAAYKAVYHLSSAAFTTDSTGNGNTGTATNWAAATGIVGSGGNSTASPSNINVGQMPNLFDSVNTILTISAWKKWGGVASDLIAGAGWTGLPSIVCATNSAADWELSRINTSSATYQVMATPSSSANVWYYVVFSLSLTNTSLNKIYKDGLPLSVTTNGTTGGTYTPNGASNAGITGVTLGQWSTARFSGWLDEFRFSTFTPTNDQVAAEYANMNTASILGTTVPLGGGTVQPIMQVIM